MNIKIDSNFQFSVVSIQYTATGELSICLSSECFSSNANYQYSASLGNSQAEEKPTVSLQQYARNFAASANIKDKRKDSYRLMCNHLEAYGDITIDKITTAYLQDFIKYLQSQGMKPGSVRLYFQKLACVLHDAYKNGLFDDRILQRVKRPKREQEKKSFLSETELKKLAHHHLSEEYNNIQKMFLFSCMTGLRYSDVQGLRWKDVKRSGKHLQLESGCTFPILYPFPTLPNSIETGPYQYRNRPERGQIHTSFFPIPVLLHQISKSKQQKRRRAAER